MGCSAPLPGRRGAAGPSTARDDAASTTGYSIPRRRADRTQQKRDSGLAHQKTQPMADERNEGRVKQREPRRSSQCFRCGAEGHYARDCPASSVQQVTLAGREGSGTRPEESATAAIAEEGRGVKLIRVNGKEWRARLDTEACITVASASAARALGLQLVPTEVVQVRGIGGACDPLGECTVSVEIDGQKRDHVQVVVLSDAAMNDDVILIGKPVLDQEELLTVYHEGTALLLGAQAFPELVRMFPSAKGETVKLRTERDVVLPPRSISFVRTIPMPQASGGLVIEEQPCGILCEVRDGQVSIPVVNAGSREVWLKRDTVLKRAWSVENDDVYPSSGLFARPTVAKVQQVQGGEVAEICGTIVGNDAPEDVKRQLQTMVLEYQEVFASSMRDLSRTALAEFAIEEVSGSRPVQSRPYRLSLAERGALAKIIEQMQDAGMIEPSASPYASPVLLVRKKNGDWRLVIDYRRLNAQTVGMHYPLPLIDDVLDAVAGRKLYTTLDLAWGYFQIPFAAASAQKAAFITPDGHFQPTVMMMGLRNAPAKFQELMCTIRNKIGSEDVQVYMDDLIICGDSYEQQLEGVRRVLSVLKEAGLAVRLEKCRFFTKSVEFLGVRISEAGVQPGTRTLTAITDFPRPTNTHDVRRFNGLASFFRRFVRNFASRMAPLTTLLRKNATFVWDDGCERAFQDIKRALQREPVVARFEPGLPTELHTDASGTGLGAVLLQKHPAGSRLVYAISRRLSSSEANYHSTKLEQLAVVWAMQRLRHYLVGQQFVVVTDCSAVASLTSPTATGQIARWMDRIAEFTFTVKHRPGTGMAHVDALSRAPTEHEAEDDVDSELAEAVPAMSLVCAVSLEEKVGLTQVADADLKQLMEILQKKPGERTSKETSGVQGYVLRKGMLYRKLSDHSGVERYCFVVPKGFRKYVCVVMHDHAGHFGIEKTLQLLRERYWFPQMKAYVERHIKGCLECIYNKDFAGRKEGLCNPIPPERRPFQKLFIDHLGPLPKSQGNEHIIVLVDGLSKYVLLEGVKSTSSRYVIRFLERTFLRWGKPDKIVTDRGTAFTCTAFKEFLKTNGVQHVQISTQHPQANGQVERINKEVARVLRTSCRDTDARDWMCRLEQVQSFMNRVQSKSTGKCAFETLHGYLPRLDNLSTLIDEQQESLWTPPAAIQDRVRAEVLNAQENFRKNYDRRRKPHVVRYSVGDVVAARRLPKVTGEPTKLQAKFRGPMVIAAVLPNDTYRITKVSATGRSYVGTAHCSQLRLYHYAGEESEEEEMSEAASRAESTEDGVREAGPEGCPTELGRSRSTGGNGGALTDDDDAAEAGSEPRRSGRRRRPPSRYDD